MKQATIKSIAWIRVALLFCLCLPIWTLADMPEFSFTEPPFEIVGDAESIPLGIITDLAQDTRGLIWIGTQEGLICYDGYRFRKFSHDARIPGSLAGDFVVTLRATRDGRIWVGSQSDGISVFDPATERFENFRNVANQPGSLAAGRIWAIATDAHEGMWIATEQSLDYLPRASKTFIHFAHDAANPHSLSDSQVRSLLFDQHERLWVGTNSGLQRLSPDGKRFETITKGQSIQALFQAADGKIWLGTNQHGAAWLQADFAPDVAPDVARDAAPNSGSTPNLPKINWLGPDQLSHAWVRGIVQVPSGQIWLATGGGGINIVSASDGRVLQRLRHDATLPSSLAHDTVQPFLLDRAGWLWVGTWGGGLQRMNANNTMLHMMRYSPNRASGLSHPDIHSVLALANGQWLFGSKGNGIDIVDRERGLIGGYRKAADPAQAGTLPDATIYALAQTPDGAIWAGTQLSGVLRLAANSKTWEPVPGVPHRFVRKLLSSRDGSLWVGTNRGLAHWRMGADHFDVVPDEYGKAMQNFVLSLAEDRQGRIWVGTANGLWLQESGRKGLIHIPAEPKKPRGLVSDLIKGLLIDRHDQLWLATDKGLERLLRRNGALAEFEHISDRLGQPGKSMGNNLMEDQAGRIWSEQVVIDPVKMKMVPITRAEAMDIGVGWFGSYAQTSDGLLLYGGTKGVAIINPQLFKAWDYAPPLVAVELKVNGKNQALAAVNNGSFPANRPVALTLNPEQRSFALEFAALDYSDPKKNRYQYRLQGYDKDWIDTDADHRSAAYGNLWPGNYVLVVRGSNRLGDWSAYELNIAIRVLPAYWQTWWFWLLALVLTGGIAYAAYRRRLTQIRAQGRDKARFLKMLVEERTKEISAAHDKLAAAHQHLKMTQVQLVQSEKMASLGQLVAGVAHELNTPIGNALTTASTLADVSKELRAAMLKGEMRKSTLNHFVDNVVPMAEMISRSCHNAAALISSFKQVAVDQTSEKRRTFNLHSLVEDNISALRASFKREPWVIETDIPPDIECDRYPGPLGQVVTNLVQNAFIHAFSGRSHGVLKISARVPGNTANVEIIFQDDGKGMDAAILAHIFEPFYTTRLGQGGSGLGLSISLNIVTGVLGGTLQANSTPGTGTRFELIFPQKAAQSPPPMDDPEST